MAKKTDRAKAVDNLDNIFSKFVRLRDSDSHGFSTCVTCPKVAFWTREGIQCGHFQTRGKYITRWHERNAHAQCAGCNMVNGGQQYKHGLEIDKRYGEGAAEEILLLSNQTQKFSTFELVDMYNDFKERVELMIEEKGV